MCVIDDMNAGTAIARRWHRRRRAVFRPFHPVDAGAIPMSRSNLKATNGQVIGTSQMYATAQTRDTGISSVKTNGPTKNIRDNT
jgi:uncharacterized protein YegP (UPF0339 family)